MSKSGFTLQAYLEAVAAQNRSLLVRSSGEKQDLRSLYFLQRFGEGRHAFVSYADLSEQANRDTEHVAEPIAEDAPLHQRLQRYLHLKSAVQSAGRQEENPSAYESLRQSLRMRYREVAQGDSGSAAEADGGKGMPFKSVSGVETEELGDKLRNAIGNVIAADRKTEDDPLMYEQQVRCEKLVLTDAADSRVIIFASAGYGKSTLLQRIALAYSDTAEGDGKFRAAIEQGEMETPLIPVMLELRNMRGRYAGVEEQLVQTMQETMEGTVDEAEIREALGAIRGRLLLLIDGLDELSLAAAMSYLYGLEHYLEDYPNTRVIMTTRISGVGHAQLQVLLRRMGFRGRTILPLSSAESHAFCKQWIQVTQGENEALLTAFDRIQSESHLRYLREFMRKPLELVILLHYIPRQSFSSFNRWELFYNILWAEITNHASFEDKQTVFDDECKFLGFIAYQMQIRNKLSLTYQELEDLLPALLSLSFYSDIFGSGGEEVAVSHIWGHLHALAQNLGLVEIIEEQQLVTIPLRSYQEYLTAYACCNLCLIENTFSPQPDRLLAAHVNKPNWLGVLGFAIAGMEYSGYAGYEEFLMLLYRETERISSLCDLVETDYFNSRPAAKALCQHRFSGMRLEREEKALIEKCMASKSAFSFRWAMTTLCKEAWDSGHPAYLEAAAWATLYSCISKGQSPVDTALVMLGSQKAYERAMAAALFVVMARIRLDEETLKTDVLADCNLPVTLYSRLRELAESEMPTIYLQALTELLVSGVQGWEQILPYLDGEALAMAAAAFEADGEIAWEYLRRTGSWEPYMVRQLTDYLHLVGLFPVALGQRHTEKGVPIWLNALCGALSDRARRKRSIDQVSAAICIYHMDGNQEALAATWVEEICHGRPSAEVRKDYLTKRENRHFLMVRSGMQALEERHRRQRHDSMNLVEQLQRKAPTAFQLFAAGEDAAALALAQKEYRPQTGKGVNLAFLMRFVQQSTGEKLDVYRRMMIEMLLKDGIAEKQANALLNGAFLAMEQENTEKAAELLAALDDTQLQETVAQFWYPVLWEKRHHPEGAFVSLLAGYEASQAAEMRQCIESTHPAWLLLLTDVLQQR